MPNHNPVKREEQTGLAESQTKQLPKPGPKKITVIGQLGKSNIIDVEEDEGDS